MVCYCWFVVVCCCIWYFLGLFSSTFSFKKHTYFFGKRPTSSIRTNFAKKSSLEFVLIFFCDISAKFQKNFSQCCHKMLPSNSLFQDCCELCKWGENTDGRWDPLWKTLSKLSGMDLLLFFCKFLYFYILISFLDIIFFLLFILYICRAL